MQSGSTHAARTRRAEREGFEPSIRVSTYAGLANRCLQPLGHLSGRVSEVIGGEIVLQPIIWRFPSRACINSSNGLAGGWYVVAVCSLTIPSGFGRGPVGARCPR